MMKKRIFSILAVFTMTLGLMSGFTINTYAAPEAAQEPTFKNGKLNYEAAISTTTEGTYINTNPSENITSFEGTGYVFQGTGSFEMNINVPFSGAYDITMRAANNGSGNKYDGFYLNDVGYQLTLVGMGAYAWGEATIGTGAWQDGTYIATPPSEGFNLTEGSNIVKVAADWGYTNYDSLYLTPKWTLTEGEKLYFDISNLAAVVTLDDKAAVEALAATYNGLSDAEKAKVKNYSKLENAINQIEALEKIEPQTAVIDGDKLIYEVEESVLLNESAFISDDDANFKNFSGAGYIYVDGGTFKMIIDVPAEGKYRMYVVAANDNNGARCDFVSINGGKKWLVSAPAEPVYGWTECQPGDEHWSNNVLVPQPPSEGFDFVKGENEIEISANWGKCAYDKVILIPASKAPIEENNSVKETQKLIDALTMNVTEKDKEAVTKAYHAYNSLTKDEKAKIIDVETLFVARARINALDAGDKYDRALRFEAEEGVLSGNTAAINEKTNFKDFSGNGYVFLFDSKFSVDVYAPKAGKYQVYVVGGSDDGNNKSDFVSVNGSEKLLTSYLGSNKGKWSAVQPGTENWENDVLKPLPLKNGFQLEAGKNTIEVSANWGYSAYDSIIIVPLFDYEVPQSGQRNSAVPFIAIISCTALAFVLMFKRKKMER